MAADDDALIIAEHARDARQFLDVIETVPIERVPALLVSVKERFGALEERRFAITRPMDKAKSEVMDLFRPALDTLTACERALKKRVADDRRDRQQRTRRQLEAAAAAGDNAAVAAAAKPAPKMMGVRTREVTRWTIEDESKVPDQYWVRVLDKNALAVAVGEGKDVPGVRTWKDTVVSAGRGL